MGRDVYKRQTMHHRDIVQKVDMREAQFLRRSQFDEIQYGSAVLKRNGKGAILRPVNTLLLAAGECGNEMCIRDSS